MYSFFARWRQCFRPDERPADQAYRTFFKAFANAILRHEPLLSGKNLKCDKSHIVSGDSGQHSSSFCFVNTQASGESGLTNQFNELQKGEQRYIFCETWSERYMSKLCDESPPQTVSLSTFGNSE